MGESSFFPLQVGWQCIMEDLWAPVAGVVYPLSVCLSSITPRKSLKAQPVGLPIGFVGLGREAYIILHGQIFKSYKENKLFSL